ncbi:cytochrome c oxidase assembly protein [Ferdinandcohnia quinoae]|uniref:Cytochrome c oxidase assembly protein n=1 Tax=Fredinandcohnia quinoae TaxID=2918902 RepID=A0AAW5E308_9BACI|nr:cytochrome c oxidase assembly protein [Fredinandcohnia sp. SECRCQ15]MCH1624277.1 cytochrome c oxidase assembly protein [Fredinandcohnia sp. SECRCQ15]
MIGQILEGFSFHAQWNGGIIFFSLILIVLYLFLLPTSKSHTTFKSIAFISSMILILLTMGSPLNLLGRMLFRAHIIQMILLLLVVAPLIVMGLKTDLLEKLLNKGVARKIYSVLTHPVFTIVLFHALFMGYHIPVVFDWIRTGYFTNYFFLIGLVVAAMLVWWPLISPIQKYDRLNIKKKFIYIFVNVLLFIPVTLFLLLADKELYTVYSDTSLMLSALELCLPPGTEIPANFLETLLPYPPFAEQKNGAILLGISQAVLFGIGALLIYLKERRAKKAV